MVTFNKDEIFTATEVVRNFSSILTRLSKDELKQAVIVKNNKFETVMLSMSEYERLKEAVTVLESIYQARKSIKNGE